MGRRSASSRFCEKCIHVKKAATTDITMTTATTCPHKTVAKAQSFALPNDFNKVDEREHGWAEFDRIDIFASGQLTRWRSLAQILPHLGESTIQIYEIGDATCHSEVHMRYLPEAYT